MKESDRKNVVVATGGAPNHRIHAGGVMVDRIRNHSWDQSELGPIDEWPEVLITTLNVILMSPVPIQILWGVQFRLLYNDAFSQQLGLLDGEALGSPAREVWKDAWPLVEEKLQATMSFGAVSDEKSAIIPVNRNGTLEETYWDFSYSPIYMSQGKVGGVLNISREVTKEVLAERELQLITDALPAYVSYLDQNLRYVRVNRAYEDLLGRSASEVVGKTIDEVLDPAAAERVRMPLTKALEGEAQGFSYEITENGKTRVLNVSHIPDFARDGTVRGVVVEAHDVTVQKRMERELQQSYDRFRNLIDRASVGVAIGHVTGELFYLNPALLNLLGYSSEEVASGNVRWDEITPARYAERDKQAIDELTLHGVATPYEKIFLAKNGSPVPFLIGASVIPNTHSSESDSDIAVFATDLTVQKRAELALLQTEKLAAVGKLASMISHEINNPLEAVTNLLYIARQDETLSGLTRDTLDFADRELARVAQVTTQTLRFHRQSTAAMSIRPEELLEEVLRLYGTRLANAQIDIKRSYKPDVRVTCFEGDIRQVLANIVGNAIDAMRTGGTMTVRTRYATRWSIGSPGVMITVADTGSGMSEEVRANIFEAFYTTKGIHGTGLGLWVSCRIIHKHRGYVRALSSTHSHRHGTAFIIWLPLELASSAGDSWQASM